MKDTKLVYVIVFIFLVIVGIGVAVVMITNQKKISPNNTNAPVSSPVGKTVTVEMIPNAFNPTKFTINQNDVVCWVNKDTQDRWPASNIHPTHDIYPAFDPKRGIKPGETWCFQFDQAGIWFFHDHLLPQLVGSVTVNSQ